MTKGPWHVNAISKGRIIGDSTAAGPVDKYFINNHNATVASVYRPADARLIAAAPDLYAAAKAWALLGWCANGNRGNDASACSCDWHLCVRAVAAVEREP